MTTENASTTDAQSARLDLHMAFGPVGAKIHMAPGDGWPDSVRGRLDCGSAGQHGRLEQTLFQVGDAFENAYAREFDQDRRTWTWFQLAEHGFAPRSLCFRCFPIAYRHAYAGWLKTVKTYGLPAHLEAMIAPPAGTPMTKDNCRIGGCRLTSTHVLFYYNAEEERWAKTNVCFPHGATWELGEGLWELEPRAAALLPRHLDQLPRDGGER